LKVLPLSTISFRLTRFWMHFVQLFIFIILKSSFISLSYIILGFLRLPHLNIISPIPLIHFYLNSALVRRTNGRTLEQKHSCGYRVGGGDSGQKNRLRLFIQAALY
jgi:hypothetical protein